MVTKILVSIVPVLFYPLLMFQEPAKPVEEANPLVAARSPEERGKQVIYHEFRKARPVWLVSAYRSLPEVWAQQSHDLQESERLKSITPNSRDFYRELRLRYGIVYAHYRNQGLPLGINLTYSKATKGKLFVRNAIRPPLLKGGGEAGMNLNCMLCHSRPVPTENGWAIAEGLGNSHLDFQRFHEDMCQAADSNPGILLKRNPERNSFVSAGDAIGLVALHVRHADDSFDELTFGKLMATTELPPGYETLAAQMKSVPMSKTPAWAGISIKKGAVPGYYADGSRIEDFSTVLGGVLFNMDPRGSDYKQYRKVFDAYAWPYLQTLDAPAYPVRKNLDTARVQHGYNVYESNCSHCHGTYVPASIESNEYRLVEYPGVLIDLEEVETDSRRAFFTDELIESGKQFGRTERHLLNDDERGGTGYVAPPLNALWARAPYLHNGSVPYLSQVLNSGSRWKVYATDLSINDPIDIRNFDAVNGGWKVENYSHKSVEQIQSQLQENPYLRVFDPRLDDWQEAGLNNQGHTFGDSLTDTERSDLIQFLLTL